MIDGPALTDIIANGKVRVPSGPASATRIQRLIQNPSFSTRALAEIVSLDPPLTAAVLRVANSGDFKGLIPVSSVQQAIARLDADALPTIAVAVSAGDAAIDDG